MAFLFGRADSSPTDPIAVLGMLKAVRRAAPARDPDRPASHCSTTRSAWSVFTTVLGALANGHDVGAGQVALGVFAAPRALGGRGGFGLIGGYLSRTTCCARIDDLLGRGP